jgi:hypothetical protein
MKLLVFGYFFIIMTYLDDDIQPVYLEEEINKRNQWTEKGGKR